MGGRGSLYLGRKCLISCAGLRRTIWRNKLSCTPTPRRNKRTQTDGQTDRRTDAHSKWYSRYRFLWDLCSLLLSHLWVIPMYLVFLISIHIIHIVKWSYTNIIPCWHVSQLLSVWSWLPPQEQKHRIQSLWVCPSPVLIFHSSFI
jgi:hypothetical protein